MLLSRYFSLYKAIFKINLSREIQFRGNLLVDNLVTVFWATSAVLYYIFIYQHINHVKGWELGQSLSLIGFYLLFNSIFKSLIELNFSFLPRLVYRGNLDFFLLKPVNTQFLVSLSRFSLRSFLRMFAGLGILAWAYFNYHLSLSWLNIAGILLAMTLGLVIIYSFWFMTMLLIFFLGNLENLYFLFMPIFQVSRVPINILPLSIELVFTFIVPLVFISTVQAQIFWGLIPWKLLLFGINAAIFLLWLSHLLWRMSLRTYTSASG